MLDPTASIVEPACEYVPGFILFLVFTGTYRVSAAVQRLTLVIPLKVLVIHIKAKDEKNDEDPSSK